METRSNTQRKNPIDPKDCFVGISAEEKMLADAVLNGQKTELDPVSNDSSYDVWTYIFAEFFGFIVTGLFPGWIYIGQS